MKNTDPHWWTRPANRLPEGRYLRRLAYRLFETGLALTVFTSLALAQPLNTVGNPKRASINRGKMSYYPSDHWDLSSLPEYQPEQKVGGTIRIWGSNYFADGSTAQYWQDGFRRFHPEVTFTYHLPNSLTAGGGLYAGVADIGVGPRIPYNDISAFRTTFGYEPCEINVVTGSYNVEGWNPAFGIFVNKANPLTRITMEQLDGIFGAQRAGGWINMDWHPEFARGPESNIRTWGQLGVKGEWADKPIRPRVLNLRSHWSVTISDKLLRGSDQWNENVQMYPGSISLPDGKVVMGAQRMVEDVGEDPYGITYSTIEFLTPKTKVLEIAPRSGAPYVALSLDTVRNRTYPLFDEVFMYINRAPGKPIDPKIREFLRYILSRQGQQDVARDGKYLPLTKDVTIQQLKKLD